MPTITIRMLPDFEERERDSVVIPSSEMLRSLGPIVEATLTVSDAQQKALALKGEPAKPKAGMVLFDTGASVTCFDNFAAEEIGLAITGMGQVASATHEEVQAPIYPGKVNIGGLSFDITGAFGGNLRFP